MIAHCVFFPKRGKNNLFMVEFHRVSAKGKFAIANATWSEQDFNDRLTKIAEFSGQLNVITKQFDHNPIKSALFAALLREPQPTGGLGALGAAYLQNNPVPLPLGFGPIASKRPEPPQKKKAAKKK